MPIFVLKCEDANCGDTREMIMTFEKAHSFKCKICGGATSIVPSLSAFKVNGYSFENGYHRETINYDGSSG